MKIALIVIFKFDQKIFNKTTYNNITTNALPSELLPHNEEDRTRTYDPQLPELVINKIAVIVLKWIALDSNQGPTSYELVALTSCASDPHIQCALGDLNPEPWH